MRIPLLLLLLTASAIPACAELDPGDEPGGPDRSQGPDLVRSDQWEGSPGASSDPNPLEAEAGARIVFLGTSLTEGYGLARPGEEAWPARIGQMADSAGVPVQIVNAGLSGETSAGALRRADWVLRQSPDVLVVETGGNDGLRALPPEELESNLDGILTRVAEVRPETRVVLLGMEAPPNLGADYGERFREAYVRVAERWAVAFVPFLLDGVAGYPELNQRDGIHPTAEGHAVMARNVWPALEGVMWETAER